MGLEARSPFLDHKLAEFCAAIPPKFKVKGTKRRYIQTELAKRYFIYPLLLMSCGILVALLWDMLTRRRESKFVFLILFIVFASYQVYVSCTREVNAAPGKEEMYSLSRTYLDNKIC